VLAAEHKMFCGLFDSIEKGLPRLKSLAEARHLARLVEGLLRHHAKAEEDLLLQAHSAGFEERTRGRRLHEEHHEIDVRLKLVSGVKNVAQARVLLKAALAASRKHFAEEERESFPLVEKCVAAQTLQRLGTLWLLRHHCPTHWVI